MVGPTTLFTFASSAALVLGCTSIAGVDGDYSVGDTSTGTSTSTSTSTSGGGGGSGGAGGSTTSGEGGSGGSEPPCVGDDFECLDDGTAQQCVNGSWETLGACPLGCDENLGICQVPSNVEPDALGAGTDSVAVTPGGPGLTFNTDTGEITMGMTVVRPAGVGLDPNSGIAFASTPQGSGEPALGVFSMTDLTVPDGAVLSGVGKGALVLLVDGTAQIDGLVTVAAADANPGPGGFPGGAPGTVGGGPCPGQPGDGAAVGHYCTSGSGGAGYGGLGGPGGACTCASPDNYAAGLGGPICGVAELIPLLGGSGGSGGSIAAGGPSNPGPGGSGGGALQITAAGAILVSATGRIDAGGEGGKLTTSAGGSGGGAGGALLLEAPAVTISVGAVLAANGGGGGGGDCT